MRNSILNERLWKIFLCIALLVVSTVLGLAISNWRASLVQGVASDLRLEVDSIVGSTARLSNVSDESPFKAHGVQPGESITFDDSTVMSRASLSPGEKI